MEVLRMNLDKNGIIHMIGIGGISMSGIAKILVNMGYKVKGSDATLSHITESLEDYGIEVIEGHSSENVEGSSIIVYSAAIKQDNPELVRAKELGIPTIERADFLGEITKQYSKTIAISGTHGKTTTTSMTSPCFIANNLDPTIQVGAQLRQLDNNNYRVGNSKYFVVEACEYFESFLKFHPKIAVVLNIEEDHLDYYKNFENIKSSFKKFVELVPKDGYVIINGDDVDCIDIIKDVKGKAITFGINNEFCSWIAKDIKVNDNGCYSFTAVSENENIKIDLSIPGYHNIYNALATIAISASQSLDFEIVKKVLFEYTGASRRFEYVGMINGAKIYDDYAHHPTEIKATINAVKNIKHDKLWVVFQPHTYSRTISLFEEFSTAFVEADNLILTDIYAAREKDTGEVSSEALALSINEYSNNCTYISKFKDIISYLKENVKENDIVLTLGAGSVTEIGYMLIK
jgi:UDP-N-acetylmuramate--alanine ligase